MRAAPSPAPTVAAVLVNYRAPGLVSDVVGVLAAGGVPALVADNSGDLGDAPFAVVDCGSNIGFGAACNRAIAALDPAVEVVCLHNADVVPDPAAIRRLAARVVRGDGALAPTVQTGATVRTRGFHAPGLAREIGLVARARWQSAPGGRRVGTGSSDASAARHIAGRGARFGTGALLVIDRAAFDAVGGFDERFFLYGEDADLWHRLTRAGFRNRFVADEVVEHVGKAGSEMGRGTRELLRWLGVELYAELHGRLGWGPYRTAHRCAHRCGLGPVGADPELVRIVEGCWRRGERPSAVLGEVRGHFESSGSLTSRGR